MLNFLHDNTKFLGKNVLYTHTCFSTQDIIHHKIRHKQDNEGMLATTNYQINGRGQQKNKWYSKPFQHLTFSFLLYPHSLTTQKYFDLNIMICLAIHKCLKLYIKTNNLKIKWPNDIFYQNKKLAGILVENYIYGSMVKKSVIGVGINVNAHVDKSYCTTYLQDICYGFFSLYHLLNELLLCFEHYYHKNLTCNTILKKKYIQNMYKYQQKVSFFKKNSIIQGKIIGITALGLLIVQHIHDKSIHYYTPKTIKWI